MKPIVRLFAITIAMFSALVALSILSFSKHAPPDPTPDAAKHQYVGALKCKLCHTSEKSGKQYPIWHDSKHAHAYASLASDSAKAIATKLGIADPQKSDKCLKCHVTGYNATADMLGEKYNKEEGVTCEGCHGAGGDYWKKETMQSIYDKKTDGASVGLVIPDEKTCVTCHNSESPTFKAFDFKTMEPKIAHKVPKG